MVKFFGDVSRDGERLAVIREVAADAGFFRGAMLWFIRPGERCRLFVGIVTALLDETCGVGKFDLPMCDTPG
ncbi:MAG: hypothetical protein FWB71_01470 [Defluviitaleaceae bacterium]|nr:hypothetical protein [Defluviitaleaceae bacterium]